MSCHHRSFNKYKGKIKSTHTNFNLFPKIDVYMIIKSEIEMETD